MHERIAMQFVITGATGDVGARVVRHLLERGFRPRVFVRDAAKARALFDAEIFEGDLGNASSLREALEGADSLFLLNSGPRIPERDTLAAEAARASGITHIVKLSSIDVEQSLALGAWHEQGEAAVRASGVPYTFLRPTGFMSNLLAWAPSIRNEGLIRTATGSGRRAFIHSEDIAAVAVKVLVDRICLGEVLPLTGPEALTFAEAASRIGAALGKRVGFEAISDEEAAQRFAATGASPAEVAAHEALWRAIREGRLGMVTDTVERLLGRGPIPLEKWVREHRAAFV
jgi:uncharacterized protein YbjT (DUF2867 family)